MRTIAVFPRHAAGLTLSPTAGWRNLAEHLQSRAALAWFVGGSAACFVLLLIKARQLAAANLMYATAGGHLLAGLGLAVQLAGTVLYLFAGAWLVLTLLKGALPRLTYGQALGLVSYAAFPLLVAWICRTVVAWQRPVVEVAFVGGFHPFIEALWAALSVRADLAAWLPVSSPLLTAVALSASLFWVWHAVTLWAGLEVALGAPRRWALVVLVTLFGLVLAAHLVELSVAAHWRELVSWTD
jgi:hypothetical protein